MLLKKRSEAPSAEVRKIARDMVRRADAARDTGAYGEAATLYAEALRLEPGRAGVHVQAGHMLKETGATGEAERHYLAAAALTPDDADLALQLGHFYKSTGRFGEAQKRYAQAVALKPNWAPPQFELDRLAKAGWRGAQAEADAAPVEEADDTAALIGATGLAPDLAPRPAHELLHGHAQTIELRRLGRRDRSHWGIMPTLRGIEALRGFILSETPIVEVQVSLNGQLVFREAPVGGFTLEHEGENRALRKYVFNFWIDLSGFVPGRYDIEFRALDSQRRSRLRHEAIVIAPPLDAVENASCDGVVAPAADERQSLVDRINALPSVARPSFRPMLLATPPRNVLIQRADQLGDMVVSIPALRRLREILPEANFVGLVSRANADLAATLGLFDELLLIDFPDDPWERRRVMPLDEQEALRQRLAPYAFDMAIDFSENGSSRPLLTLSGAPFLFGFRSGAVPTLTVEIEGNTHDVWDGHEVVPHTNKLMGMVEWLGAMLKKHSSVIRRDDLSPDRLATFGLLKDDRFAVLHDGARLKFSRWPHYLRLAEMLLEHSDLRVVMLTDDPALRETLPPSLAGSSRFQLIDQRLLFDDFDALLSYCSLFVGNDSGPKHLASLRGAKVVSVHMARNNWNEWGQENGGTIISRRVPCAGCLIWHDPEECGKDYACIRRITPDEVFAACWKLL